jgi:Lambda phage tail tape-measure protein (Tape_meas_lam_C)
MVDASTNTVGPMAAMFRALGINVVEATGELRNTGDVFDELAAKFAAAKDGPEKVEFAKLLGKSGDVLIPFMNDLDKTTAEVRKLGVTTSTEFAASADVFNDTVSKMGSKLAAFGRDILLPVLNLFNKMHGDFTLGNLEAAVSTAQAKIDAFKKSLDGGGTSLEKLLKVKPDPNYLKDLEAGLAAAQQRLRDFIGETGKLAAGAKISLPVVADPGQVKLYESLVQDIEKATKQAQIAITTDEAAAAYERMRIVRDEFIFKAQQLGLWVEDGKHASAQQIEVQKAFQNWMTAAQKKAAFEARTPLQQMTEEWANTTKQMQDATTRWASSSAEALTDFVTTGKADFKSLADSIIRDLVRIFIQQKVIGTFGSATTAGAGLLGLFGGLFAEGGNPPVGMASIVGENGPEVIVPRTASTVIPSGSLGGSTYVIDARGADREGLARLEAMIRKLDGSIEHRAVSAWVRDRSRGGVTSGFA